MKSLPQQLEVKGLPAYVESWSVARIPGFVLAVLERWQRNHGELPPHFTIVMCPQAELNARGGVPDKIIEISDAKLRCAHFTGCHKPYFVVIFADSDAESRCAEASAVLAWSEAYSVEVRETGITLIFVGCREDLDDSSVAEGEVRKLQALMTNGELIRILD